jgi:adenylosuccinate synthase
MPAMTRAAVVIGAHFGDEGKGLLTDFLARPDSVVVRFNGGAQAGHTVQTPTGQRHVFHHIGAGSLRGSETHLSRYFISNPLLLADERAALARLGLTPTLSADPAGLVTTPYDMMLNQMAEQARGEARHGSCGLGINETIKRHNRGPAVSVAILGQPAKLRGLLHVIRTGWVAHRARALGLTITPDWRRRLDNDAILDGFVDAAGDFAVNLIGDRARLHAAADQGVVFEGAQGLLLDQAHRFFPHVTHSNTGLRNVIALAEAAGIAALDVTYVSRPTPRATARGRCRMKIRGWVMPMPPMWRTIGRAVCASPGSISVCWAPPSSTICDGRPTPRWRCGPPSLSPISIRPARRFR